MAGEVKDVRKKGLLYVLIVFGVCTAWFFSRQNYAGQIGGQISIVKTLWLYYAISAWIIIPIFYFHSNKTNLILSRIYKFHLISFTIRALVELWMLYVTISWIPPYGIAHDVFAISLIAFSLWYFREKLHLIADKGNVSAKRFLYSIQIGLCIEIVFAWLFYRVTGGQVGIYFARACVPQYSGRIIVSPEKRTLTGFPSTSD